MRLYINFHNFDQPTLAFLRESISQLSSLHGWCFIEWDEELHENPADISLIYADDLPWFETVRISNLVPGKWVVLVGDRSPQIGLPVLSAGFKWSDLPQFTDVEEWAPNVRRSDPLPVRFSLTMPGSVTALG